MMGVPKESPDSSLRLVLNRDDAIYISDDVVLDINSFFVYITAVLAFFSIAMRDVG